MNRKRPGARVRASYPFGRPAPRALLWLLIAMPHPVSGQEAPSSFEALYQEHCAVCHGASLEGAAQGSPLAGIDLVHGSSVADLQASIANGFSDRGMPAWSRVLTAGQISSLAIFIAERRTGYGYDDFRIGSALTIPSDTIPGELHDLRLETVIDGLDPLPYSIAPLPDGSMLLTPRRKSRFSGRPTSISMRPAPTWHSAVASPSTRKVTCS